MNFQEWMQSRFSVDDPDYVPGGYTDTKMKMAWDESRKQAAELLRQQAFHVQSAIDVATPKGLLPDRKESTLLRKAASLILEA